MKTANHLINAIAGDDADEAHNAFESAIQDKISDYLEVRKVELASTIMDDLVQEGAGSTPARQYVRQVAAVGSAYIDRKRSINRNELKAHAAKNVKKLGPETVQYHTSVIKQMRDTLKARGQLPGLRKEEALEEGGPTRKHFQQVADLIKEIPDAAKRKELAQHHAGIFKGQNPRFDHARFYKAAGVNEALEGGSKPAHPTASNSQLGKNVATNIRRATQSLGLKINANMAMQGHKDFAKLVAKNPKAPGYMLLRKLAPAKAQAVQGLTQAGVPLGGALDAHPSEFNQVIQRIKRFK
jgi:hypothetical protein